jgi:hypothetical protein
MPEQSSSFSPTAAEIGSTVDDPEMSTSPSASVGQSPDAALPPPSSVVSSVVVSSSSPQAATTRPNTRSSDSQAVFFLRT